jgi:hypothetical protein
MAWHKPSDQLPEDNQECILLSHDPGGFGKASVYGPIAWRSPKEGESSKGMWWDLFATPEAGEVVSIEHVAYWRPWDEVEP